jgi:hypothetical protein
MNIYSWGYLFQMALLEVSSVQYHGGYWSNQSPLSFLQSDLYADLYSYSALMLSNNNRSSLLDAGQLTKTSQQVFSNLFQWFISLPNDYDGYWAYQPVGASPDPGLRPPRVTTSLTTNTYLGEAYTVSYSAYTTTTASLLGKPVSTIIHSDSSRISTGLTMVTVRETFTITLDGVSPTTSPLITQKLRLRDTTPPPSSITPRTIVATISKPAEVLAVSSVAIFFSIAILAILFIFTVIIYTFMPIGMNQLPRDVNTLASVLAFVYASEKLNAWTRQKHEQGRLAVITRSRLWGNWTKEQREHRDLADNDILVGMGTFLGSDGSEHWGVELVEEGQGTEVHEVKNGMVLVVDESSPDGR